MGLCNLSSASSCAAVQPKGNSCSRVSVIWNVLPACWAFLISLANRNLGRGGGVGGEACAAAGEKDKPQRSGWCFWCLKDTTLRLPWRAHSRAVCVQVPIPRRSIFWVFVHSRIYCFITLAHTWMLPQTKSLSAYQRWNLQIFKVGSYIPGGTRFPVLCSLLINFL